MLICKHRGKALAEVQKQQGEEQRRQGEMLRTIADKVGVDFF